MKQILSHYCKMSDHREYQDVKLGETVIIYEKMDPSSPFLTGSWYVFGSLSSREYKKREIQLQRDHTRC